MITVSIEEAKEKLEELIEKAHTVETVAIVSRGRKARLKAEKPKFVTIKFHDENAPKTPPAREIAEGQRLDTR
jgi:hypothetical protein